MEAKDLYRALEFAHYAERLRDTVTVLVLSRNTPFRDIVLDIKVLASYRARVVVVVPDPNFELQRTLALMNTHGGRFRLIEEEPEVAALFAVSLNERLLESLAGLGFEPIDREALPEEWRRGYDFARPSKAYAKRLRA